VNRWSTPAEARAHLAGLESRHNRLTAERDNLNAQQQTLDAPDPGIAERIGNLENGLGRIEDEKAEINELLGELDARNAFAAAAVASSRGHEAGAAFHTNAGNGSRSMSPVERDRDTALRAIERQSFPAPALDMLDSIVKRDGDGTESRYIAAHANPAYARAFGRILSRPGTAQYENTPEEAEALRTALEANRAMAVGTGSAGGYGVPIAIDPTIALTSDGAINPLREIATVRSITTSEWRGVSSAGVTAAFGAEASEVADGTPTLAQPTIVPERATAFVPFSFEVGGDYPGFQQEIAKLLADAKDVLEAEKYVTGAGHGSHEPQGLLVGATGTVAGGTASYAVAHVYNMRNALAPRFQPRARWLSSLAIKNGIRRLVGTADADEPLLFNDAGDQLLGKPWHEVSDMPTATTAGNDILVYGDIAAGFEIVDRIGMSIELVPHLFGGSGRPTGQRGFLAWWRTSSGVINQSAIKLLETT
jgi:HK97 family phage major capsid protein